MKNTKSTKHLMTDSFSNSSRKASAVSIVTMLWAERHMFGSRLGAGKGLSSLRHRVKSGSGAHPASYPTGTGALPLEVKRPGREADRSPPFITDVKNGWSYTSTRPCVFMACC
jgi:hypothetical protein